MSIANHSVSADYSPERAQSIGVLNIDVHKFASPERWKKSLEFQLLLDLDINLCYGVIVLSGKKPQKMQVLTTFLLF